MERGGKLHAPPQIPDGTFTDWRYTNNVPGPWTELRFQYGNTRVTGNVLIAAYNITDGGYRNLQSQLGINQAFVTIDGADILPDGKRRPGLERRRLPERLRRRRPLRRRQVRDLPDRRTHVAGETLTLLLQPSRSRSR